ncbi:hypothetical protein LDENG_00216490, partial [Lucifuga dentata]
MVGTCWTLAAAYAYGLAYSRVNVAGLEEYLESIYCVGSCIFLFNSLWTVLGSIITFFFPCTVMVCLYAKIFLVAKQHIRKIENMSHCVNSNDRGR